MLRQTYFITGLILSSESSGYLQELAELQDLCQETSAKMAPAILSQVCGPWVLQDFTSRSRFLSLATFDHVFSCFCR